MAYYFPQDLGSQQQGHIMAITAFKSQTKGQAVAAQAQSIYNGGNITDGLNALNNIFSGRNTTNTTAIDRFYFFIPGGATNGQAMTWTHQHEYTDVKLARLASSLLGAGLGDAAVGLAALMGYPINPRVDVIFRNTNLREYQFSILMAPQSPQEAEQMKKIIKMLRYYAAPTLDNTTDLNFLTPNDFEITFHYKDINGVPKENTNIPKIAKGVIKRIDVDYTPQGEWSTFYDGTPVSALLTFTFMETQIVHKKMIEEGY